MNQVASAIVFLWLAGWALHALARLLDGEHRTAHFCVIAHTLLCGVPLALDVFMGRPSYTEFDNLLRAMSDTRIDWIYLPVVAMAPPLLYLPRRWFPPPPSPTLASGKDTQPGAENRVSTWLVMLSPVAAAALAPEPALYLDYGFVVDDSLVLSQAVYNWHGVVELLALAAIFAGVLEIGRARSPVLASIATAAPIAIACFLEGKRHIVAFFIALLAWQLWARGTLRGLRLTVFLVVMGIAFAGFSSAYQRLVREIAPSETSREEWYVNLRLDYGRDHTVRLALWSELVGKPMLPYRLYSVESVATLYIPRSMYPDKPLVYANQFTCYAYDMPAKRMIWGLTTSIFDEAIANLSWLGIIAGPLLLGTFCALADAARAPLLRITGFLVCIMFMFTNLPSFLPVFGLWVAGLAWERHGHLLALTPARRRSP